MIAARAALMINDIEKSTLPMVPTGPGQMLPPGYIHLGVAKEIAPVLRDFGIDPERVIREAGLDPLLFDDGTNVIPHAALGRLLTLCVSCTNCPHFGLLVGQRATILSLGMVGRLMQHSDTLGDALRALVSNLSIQNRGAVPSLSISDDTALFTFSVYQTDVESADQISDGAIAVTVNTLRSLCGSDWNPAEVLLPRAVPADPEPYRRHFRAPVRFDQEIAAIAFSARDLDLRIAGADPLLRVMLEERITKLKGGPGSEFSDDSRRLKGDGMGYRAIANEIRFEIARQLLEDTEVPLGQVAAALGYAEASAFTRAFRRWSGGTPTAWRVDGHHG